MAVAGSNDDEDCIDGDEGKMHYRDCHTFRLRLDAREDIEPDDVAPAHDGVGNERDRMAETSGVMCREKPESTRGQNGEPVGLDNADHGRVLIKRLTERTSSRRLGRQIRYQAEETCHRQEHSIDA